MPSRLPADYHTHTPLCKHAEGEPEAFVNRAIALGLAEYGISDHAPQIPEPFDDWRMDEEELPDYFEWIQKAREQAAGRIEIRAGLECDWLPGNEAWLNDLASRYPWDYLIGSVHYLPEPERPWDFDNPAWLGKWSQIDVDEAWEKYWKAYAEMARSGLFDILAHPDLIKKFNYRPEGDLRRFYDPVIEAIASSSAAIELNTAGWHKACEEAYPTLEFLTLARQAEIPITLSSDAHAPEELGRDFEKGISWLKQAGYTSTCLFRGRERSSRPL